jgi:uroporphyrinogen decarboxylase
VVSIDSRQPIDAAMDRLGPAQAVQGNLDPALVLAGWANVEAGARDVLGRVAARNGHIFNLGEAAPRDADPGVLSDLAALVHETTARRTPVASTLPLHLEGSVHA